MRSPFRIGCLTALTAGLAACGGGGGGPPGPDGFVAAGNRICAEGDDELAEASDAVLAAKEDRQLNLGETAAFFTDTVLPLARERLDALGGLDAPEGDAEMLADLVSAGREAVEEIAEGLRTEGQEFFAASGPNPFAEFDALAAELGLSGCVGRNQEAKASGSADEPPGEEP